MGGLHQLAGPLWALGPVITSISLLEKFLPEDWGGKEPLDGRGYLR